MLHERDSLTTSPLSSAFQESIRGPHTILPDSLSASVLGEFCIERRYERLKSSVLVQAHIYALFARKEFTSGLVELTDVNTGFSFELCDCDAALIRQLEV